jgi:peptidyl-prolyl cis-trans isomerase SurA
MMTMLRALAILLLGLSLVMGVAAPASAATVKVNVNGEGITDFQIAQRLRLFTLEGKSGNRAAMEELVDEALMMQEAKRLGITVSDSEVDTAVLNIARNIKVSADKLKEILSQAGVGMDTLRDRMRASLAWRQVTERAISPRVQISELELDQKAAGELTATNSFDYILKEVIFIGGSASARSGEANQYRKNFSGCDNAVQLSLTYRDAAVVNVGRRHATQLPDPIAKELAGLNVGGITKPRVIENGVSMLAVCSKAQARDTTFVKSEMRQEQGGAQLQSEATKYLANLRSKANIEYR